MWRLSVVLLVYGSGVSNARKNVLFLVMDDLRPDLGCYQDADGPIPATPPIYTPNIDGLAGRSLLLKRAYVQQAVCGPSRSSLLTGRRPDTTHVYDLVQYFRDVGGNFTTIPQFFKENGYISAGIGKIFHPGKPSDFDDPVSWTEPYYHAKNLGWETKDRTWDAIPDELLQDKPLIDELIAQRAVETLRHFATGGKYEEKPFFVAVGFHKPHLPFVFPSSFLQHYPPESVQLPDNPYAPDGMPPIAWSTYGEIRHFKDIIELNITGAINTTLPDNDALSLRRAYWSSITFLDSLIGTVLEELRSLGLENDTVVSLFGDHGWQLGEHAEWCKHTNFEIATHTPMMIHIPGLTDEGIVSDRLTEFVDLFPTLVEAAGLESMPLCPEDSSGVSVCREGESLMPLIENATAPWKTAAFSQFLRNKGPQLLVMGYSVRTEQYRYTEWPRYNMSTFTALWDDMFGAELYDHSIDPEENRNRAYDEGYRDVIAELRHLLQDGWRSVLPNIALTDEQV